MNVTNLEAGTLTSKTTRPKRRHAPLVGNLRQRIVLIHKLGQLAGTEKFLDRRCHRFGVDHLLRHQPFGFGQTQPFLDRALDANQADTECVFGHFANAADTAVTQVVDIIDRVIGVADIDQRTQGGDDVFLVEYTRALGMVATNPAVELHAPNSRQVVTLRIEKQIVKQVLRRIFGRRLARTHHAINFDQRLKAIGGRIDTQRIGDKRALVQLIDIQSLYFLFAGLPQLLDQFHGQLVVGLGQQLAGFLIDDVVRQDLAFKIFRRYLQFLDLGVLDLLDMAGADATPLFDDDLAPHLDIERRRLSAQPRWQQLHFYRCLAQRNVVEFEKRGQNLLVVHPQGTQNNRDRQFAAAIDAGKNAVFRIELEIKP